MFRSSGASVRCSLGLLVSASLVAACGGGSDSTAPNIPPVTTGSLVISTSGLPASLTPSFTVTSADGTARAVSGSDTIRNLQPGSATITAAMPSAPEIGRWVPLSEAYTATISVGGVSSLLVQYSGAPILLSAGVSGLPAGAIANLRFTGPDGTAHPASAGLPFITSSMGEWTLQGLPMSANTFRWEPAELPLKRVAKPGDTVAVTIPFVVTSGALEVVASGITGGALPTFTITKDATSLSRQGPGVFPDLAPGVWQLTSTTLSATGIRFVPSVTTQSVMVSLGVASTVTVPFVGTPIVTNLLVEGAYFTQAIQTLSGSAELVAGREALLRVFLRASESNTWQPMVRAKLYHGATLVQTIDLPAASAGVDLEVNEGVAAKSWNVRIDGSRIVPGLRLFVEADPAGQIAADGDPSDNVWPRGGAPQEIVVKQLNLWRVVMVPVANTPTNLTGDVTDANKEAFTAVARRLLPIGTYDVRVREPYTMNGGALQSNDANSAWIALLSEINALRAAEGTTGEYWYGVAKVNYSSGIAGYGYVPGRAAVGWDYLPSGAGVAAHEWGHNMGRPHAPCGSAASPDPRYPHPGGIIGSWGWNPITNGLIAPAASDLMGYCGNQWISAYNWSLALNYRNNSNNAIVQPSASAQAVANTDRLLVWGTITDGRVQIEPAFRLAGAGVDNPTPLSTDRTVRIDAVDGDGRVLASTVAAAPPIDHAERDVRSFAATLRLTPEQHAAITSVNVSDVRSPLASGTRQRSVAAAVAAAQSATSPRVTRANANQLRVEWDARRYPRAIVRNPRTGRILSFLSETGSTVAWSGGDVEILLSDGVRTRAERISP